MIANLVALWLHCGWARLGTALLGAARFCWRRSAGCQRFLRRDA